MASAAGKLAAADRQEIADLIHGFYALVDGGHAASTAALFSPHARLTFGPGSPRPGTIEGEAIAQAMVAREREASAFTRHVVSNFVFAAGGPDLVKVRYILVLYRSDDETRVAVPAIVADVNESWTRSESDWMIAEREITPTFARAS